MNASVIAYLDKTVVKINGLKVKGLKPIELEKKLTEIIEREVRIIGVTGDSIDMDVYGIEPDSVYKSEEGIIKALSMTDGITATEVIKINSVEKITEVDVEQIPKGYGSGCAKERWISIDK